MWYIDNGALFNNRNEILLFSNKLTTLEIIKLIGIISNLKHLIFFSYMKSRSILKLCIHEKEYVWEDERNQETGEKEKRL